MLPAKKPGQEAQVLNYAVSMTMYRRMRRSGWVRVPEGMLEFVDEKGEKAEDPRKAEAPKVEDLGTISLSAEEQSDLDKIDEDIKSENADAVQAEEKKEEKPEVKPEAKAKGKSSKK